MKDTSFNSYSYNGKKYVLNVDIYKHADLHISLDMTNITQFEYYNKFNKLVLDGTLIYTDTTGKIDSFLHEQFSYIDVVIFEDTITLDNDIEVETTDSKQSFAHTFLISNIQILNRISNSIQYKFLLVSLHWFNCTAALEYTNYDTEPEQITTIIRNCLSKQNLVANADTFDNNKTDITMNYITNGQDNLFTITKFLLGKLYYLTEKDDSIRGIVYDETHNEFLLYDLKNNVKHNGNYDVSISMFKTATETLFLPEPVNIATIVKSKGTLHLENLRDVIFYEFDYSKGNMLKLPMLATNYVNYLNNRPDTELYKDKYINMFKDDLQYLRYSCSWNNDTEFYYQAITTLTENNALILNVAGELSRKPGSFIIVSLDRNEGHLEDDLDTLEEERNRYKGFEGSWLTTSVHHIFNVEKRYYRQNITVCRNFITKPDSELK